MASFEDFKGSRGSLLMTWIYSAVLICDLKGLDQDLCHLTVTLMDATVKVH